MGGLHGGQNVLGGGRSGIGRVGTGSDGGCAVVCPPCSKMSDDQVKRGGTRRGDSGDSQIHLEGGKYYRKDWRKSKSVLVRALFGR